jgi:hypothetical protein
MLILVDFESVSFMPKTQQNMAKVNVHYPEENGSWEFFTFEVYPQVSTD